MAELQRTLGFDEALCGKLAECDGGTVFASGSVSREEFAGTLTGEYYEEGYPPARWYLIANLTRKPAEHPWDSVWCEAGFVFVIE